MIYKPTNLKLKKSKSLNRWQQFPSSDQQVSGESKHPEPKSKPDEVKDFII